MKLVQPLWKAVWMFLKKLDTELPYDPAIPLFVYLSEGNNITTWKRYLHDYSSQDMAECPGMDEWVKNKKHMVHIYRQ